ncbi:nitroreductase family protein [Terriglobus albidus]|uniref:nitroreductase family protein n=1 Tax=Terriglobus albidus TaxID=1592106 RepID=UPI001C9CDE2B|nr:nitroreductase family protein [Terriglobus albidus]
MTQRVERSPSLEHRSEGSGGATPIIYAAHSLGLGSTPMIGFDADALHREFRLAEDEVPVMLLSIGAERPGNWPQKPRRPVTDVLHFV